jgi:hypothetical protein
MGGFFFSSSSSPPFFFFFFFFFFFLLLATSVSFDRLFELEVDWDAVILLVVSGHWDFNHGGIVLQIEEKLVQMHVDTRWSGVEEDKVLLHLANSKDRALERFLDEYALLWVDHLVVTLLQLAVDVNILDVQPSQMLENLISWPSLDVLDSLLVLLCWHLFDLALLLQVIHGISELQIVSDVRHV